MKHVLLKMALISAMTSMGANAAQAQDRGYFGIEGGYTFADMKAKETAQTLADLSGSTVTYTYDKATPSLRLFAGFNLNKNFSAELGYFQTSSLDATYTITGASASESYTASGADLSLVWRPAETGFFLKAGVHASKLKGEASITIGGITYDIAGDSKSGSGALVGLGYEQGIDKNLKWKIGYTFYDSIGGISSADAGTVYLGISSSF